jgi:hypothetical protein
MIGGKWMRTGPILGLLVAGAVAWLPATALAGPRVVFKQWFSTAVPGASTGVATKILYRHPDDADAKPIAVRREVFIFPKGTRWGDAAVADCTASEQELETMGEAACPPDTRLGVGQGTFMIGFPAAGETPMEFDIFDSTGTTFLVLGAPKDGPPLRDATRGRRRGRVVTVDVPRPPGGLPDGESVLRRVHQIIDPHRLGGRASMRTPRVCPASGVWTFKARFTFADGVVDRAVHRMRCRRGRN